MQLIASHFSLNWTVLIGDTLLAELRFDLEAGLRAVVDASSVSDLAAAFRNELADAHLDNRELLLASWLQQRVAALAPIAVESIEDAIWSDVVTMLPQPDVAYVLRELAQQGIPMAAVSNAAFSGRALLAELARHGLASHLQFVLSSADVGRRKPDPTLFQVAVARQCVAATDTWFIGDTLREDIVGAIGAGLQPIWFGVRPDADQRSTFPVLERWSSFNTLYATARIIAPAG